jgi:hydrocephalus-inducing protein
LPIDISFTATQDQDFNFNLQCRVKRKPTPLVLNVKAQGYAINAALSYTSPNGEEMSLPITKNEKRMINFGHVPVNERALGRISLYNNGQYALEYRWVLSERCLLPGGGGGGGGFGSSGQTLVSIAPEEGTVEAHDKSCCELVFAPPSRVTLKGCEIMLDVNMRKIHVHE